MQHLPTNAPATVPATAPTKRRMSVENIRKGRMKVPMRILIYGGEKVGKSTFAAGAPRPVWLGKDAGSEELDIPRLPQPTSWTEALEGIAFAERLKRDGTYDTIVIDPLNWFEPLLHAHLTGSEGKTLHFKQYQDANTQWRIFQSALERAWLAGMHVIICAHSKVKRYEDPQGPAYDRHEIDMNGAAAGIFKQWVATILFARQDSYGLVDKDTKKAKGYGSDARLLHTEWSPAFDAGNRQRLPKTLPLSWPAFSHAVEHGEEQIAALKAQIEAGLVELHALDAELGATTEAKVRGYLAIPTIDVAVVANALAAKLGETKEKLKANEPTPEGETKS